VKYFFLSDGWTHGRVWEFGGIWDEIAHRRPPQIRRLNLAIREQGEVFWLYQVEDDVLFLEVVPTATASNTAPQISQVMLKRLMDAEQVIARLNQAELCAPQP
jgi:hypothetical protein